MGSWESRGGMGNLLAAVQARSSIVSAKFPLFANLTPVHPLMRDKVTVPADCARAQTLHRRPSAMHAPSVFLSALRAQSRAAGRISSESEEPDDSSGSDTGSVRRRLCQRGPGKGQGRLQSKQIHTHTDRFIHDTCRYTFIHAFYRSHPVPVPCARTQPPPARSS